MSGTHDGQVLLFRRLAHQLEGFEHKPQAQKIVDADGASLTLLKFAAGQRWNEHHSVHPILVQVIEGSIDFVVKDEKIRLAPGDIIHLTKKLLHAVIAVEPATVLVTMLTGENHTEPKINADAQVIS